MSMSPRQAALAADLRGSGGPVSLDGPAVADRVVFTDDQVASTLNRVYSMVAENMDTAFGAPPPDGWFAVAMNLRVTYASDVQPPALTPDQLADVIRGQYHRAAGGPGLAAFDTLSPAERAGWRACAVHGYNCVIADAEGVRETSLAERERLIIAQAREALGA